MRDAHAAVSAGSGPDGCRISWSERQRDAKRNRALLERELLETSLEFQSRPHHAHVQFSNVCNMSCVMCWDGSNPPAKDMPAELVERFAAQIAPHLSVITPHDGNEPLLNGWESVRRIATEYSVRVALTTNVQFLDESRFDELKDFVEMVALSVDSHIPEVFEKIRKGGRYDAVMRNTGTTARLCAEHQIWCVAQIVFMTENAPTLPETVAALADLGISALNVITLVDSNGRSGYLDPSLHFSAEYVEWIKRKCIAMAREKHVRLAWNVGGREVHDFRPAATRVAPRRAKVWSDYRDEQLRLRHPGFCRHAFGRLLVRHDGEVAPCPKATRGELHLGSLAEDEFDAIWNGPSARDLRRAHYTWDYPSLCKSCHMTDLPPAQKTLPFVGNVLDALGCAPSEDGATLAIQSPAHMTRQAEAAVIRVDPGGEEIASWTIAFALGGNADEIELCDAPAAPAGAGAVDLRVDPERWERLRPNVGYWWIVVGLRQSGGCVTSSEVRCIVRDRQLARIEGSALGYPDQGHLPATYLGGRREIGWTDRERLPRRPAVMGKRSQPNRRRFARRNGDRPAADPTAPERLSPDDYRRLVERLRAEIVDQVPRDGAVLVASKGDPALVELGPLDARHFPCDATGAYLGYHPPDDDWAIARLEEERARGARHLVLPSSMFWWLEHYKRFADHLERRYVLAAERPRDYLLYDLSEPVVESVEPVRDELAARGVPRAPAAETDKAPALLAEADRLLGAGGRHRRILQQLDDDPGDAFPRFARSASGYEITTPDGSSFVDWVSGGGPILLGYRHPDVEDAIRAQLEGGPTLSLMHPLEVEVAGMLTRMIPCADMVAFGKNGSDVVNAAVRLCRAATGRELILQYGMHGFHEWFTCMRPNVLGIPKVLRSLVRPFPYNDLGELERLLELNRGEVAGIVMEPVAAALPRPGYLEGVRRLADEHGSLLVFDEMVTGFRLANGGAQEHFGVTPDLGCFGKAMSNGMPLSAIVGKREYMELLPRVAFGMTFRGETLSLAAARAVLRVLERSPAADVIAQTGSTVRTEFARCCDAAGVFARLDGPDARLSFAFEDVATVPGATLKAMFLRECARHGVLTNGVVLPTTAHDEEAIRRTGVAFEKALDVVGGVVREAREAVNEVVVEAFSPDVRGLGSLELARWRGNAIELRGWLLAGEAPVDAIEAVLPSGEIVIADRVERPDVARAFPDRRGALSSGFALTISSAGFDRGGESHVLLRARRGEHVDFECTVGGTADAPLVVAPRNRAEAGP